MSFSTTHFKSLKTSFILATKKVLKKNISKNNDKLKEYEEEIIATHDAISDYIAPFFGKFNNTDQQFYRSELIYIRDKTLKCFGALNCKKKVSQSLIDLLEESTTLTDASDIETDTNESETDDSEEIENDNLTFVSSHENNDTTSESNLTAKSLNDSNEIEDIFMTETESTVVVEGENTAENLHNSNNLLQSDTEMPMSMLEYLRFAASTLNKNYSGDPLALNAFINSINLVKSVDEENKFTTQLKSFVLSKLEGKALECIDENKSIEEIIEALKKNIKPDSSNVISGRMLALKFNKNSQQSFSEEAEKLAEALQRSLVVEGIGIEKAKEMAIESTVKMCRQSARSDLVKSVLASSTFKDPKEVIAKLITEQSTQEQEKQILAFNKQNGFRKNNGRFNGNKGWNDRRGNHKNFNQNNGHRNNFNNKRGRGRGNYHNNRGNGHYNVRVSENYESPSNGDGQNNQQNNQTFTLERANNR